MDTIESLYDMSNPDDVGRLALYRAYVAVQKGEMTTDQCNTLAAKIKAAELARRYSGVRGKLVWAQDKAAEVAAWFPTISSKDTSYIIPFAVGMAVGEAWAMWWCLQ